MALADAAGGVNNAIQQMLMRRLAEQRYADQMKQQAFENQRQLASDERANRQFDATQETNRLLHEQQGKFQQAQIDNWNAQRTNDANKEASAARETFRPGQIVTTEQPNSPIKGWEQAGVQTGMNIPLIAPRLYTSPTDKTGQEGQAPGRGVFLTETTKQHDTRVDDQRQANRDAQTKTHETRMEQIAATNAGNRANPNDARGDRSYQFHSSQIDKVANPVSSQIERMGRVQQSVDAGTPQADALIAPELLTAMAGGQGSGLRMNEAEISRIIGGRSGWENLKAALNRWQSDPSKALAITPAQRGQIKQLMGEMQKRLGQKADAIDHARSALIDSNDPSEHRQIYQQFRKQMDAIDTGASTAAGVSDQAILDAINNALNAQPQR